MGEGGREREESQGEGKKKGDTYFSSLGLPMSLACFHDTGIVTMLHVVEQDLLEPANDRIETWRYADTRTAYSIPTTHSPAFS